MITLNYLGFTEYPSNITQPIGSTAVFRCQHQSLDAIIFWLVDGLSAGQFPNAEEGSSGNNSILTITSIQAEYNGTEVACVAIFSDFNTPREQTPPVTLTVIEG